jgi:hypothetical protein
VEFACQVRRCSACVPRQRTLPTCPLSVNAPPRLRAQGWRRLGCSSSRLCGVCLHAPPRQPRVLVAMPRGTAPTAP